MRQRTCVKTNTHNSQNLCMPRVFSSRNIPNSTYSLFPRRLSSTGLACSALPQLTCLIHCASPIQIAYCDVPFTTALVLRVLLPSYSHASASNRTRIAGHSLIDYTPARLTTRLSPDKLFVSRMPRTLCRNSARDSLRVQWYPNLLRSVYESQVPHVLQS